MSRVSHLLTQVPAGGGEGVEVGIEVHTEQTPWPGMGGGPSRGMTQGGTPLPGFGVTAGMRGRGAGTLGNMVDSSLRESSQAKPHLERSTVLRWNMFCFSAPPVPDPGPPTAADGLQIVMFAAHPAVAPVSATESRHSLAPPPTCCFVRPCRPLIMHCVLRTAY